METEPRPRTPGKVKIVLGLSLALNLLVAGMVAGAMWRDGGGDGRRGGGPSLQSYASPYVFALPREQRRALHRSIREAHPRLGREARRATYARMLTALRADPFELSGVEAVLAEQRSAILDVQEAAQARWLTAITEMSAEERAAYADRLEERLARGKRRRGKRDDRTD